MGRTRSVATKSTTCTVIGCERPYMAKGYCHSHYYRKKRAQTGPIKSYLPTLDVPPGAELVARFESFGWTITDDECWEWGGRRNVQGYGWFRQPVSAAQYPKRKLLAHRVSHEIHNGPIPDGFVILHACDNPPCVNPAHLSAGTFSENMKDMWGKGRNSHERLKDMAAASREVNRKVDETIVRDMRARYASGESSQSALGREYGISASQVQKIVNRTRWAHID